MGDDERIYAVRTLLFDFVKSPSLRHIRDPHTVSRLAQDIIKSLGRSNNVWRKWNDPRENLLKSALRCWIPIDDMRDFLNEMPGPQLTKTDVAQRQRTFEDEDFSSYPNEEVRESCLKRYTEEKALGTELPAIIGLLQDHVYQEEERIRSERDERYRQQRKEEQRALEARLLSGADCKWTQLSKTQHWFCRVNGRTYRLSPSTDKMWNLYRVAEVDMNEDGALLGKYQRRGDASKVITKLAYQPEPRW